MKTGNLQAMIMDYIEEHAHECEIPTLAMLVVDLENNDYLAAAEIIFSLDSYVQDMIWAGIEADNGEKEIKKIVDFF